MSDHFTTLRSKGLSIYLRYSHDHSCFYLNANFMLAFKKNLKQKEKLQNMYQVYVASVLIIVKKVDMFRILEYKKKVLSSEKIKHIHKYSMKKYISPSSN